MTSQALKILTSGQSTSDFLPYKPIQVPTHKCPLSEWKENQKLFFFFANFSMKFLFRWSKVLQYSLNFVKKPVSECPVATWSTPKPSNETFVESKWKHRPLLAIDLDDISIIEPQAGTVRLNRDIQVILLHFWAKFSSGKKLRSLCGFHFDRRDFM